MFKHTLGKGMKWSNSANLPQDIAKPSDQNPCETLQDVSNTWKTNVKGEN